MCCKSDDLQGGKYRVRRQIWVREPVEKVLGDAAAP